MRRCAITARWKTASWRPSWRPTRGWPRRAWRWDRCSLKGFNRNRHTKIEPKPSDRELAVMRFDDAAGKPVAILVNFAAHPTMLPSSTLKFSADYVGALKAEVTKETGAAAIFMQGAAGDQSANAGDKRLPGVRAGAGARGGKAGAVAESARGGAPVARLPGRAAAIQRAHGFRQSDGEGGTRRRSSPSWFRTTSTNMPTGFVRG
jgi:hypothetical protein